MNDIVERLLEWSNFGYGVKASRDMREAAAEIARLRAALEEIARVVPKHPAGEIARAALESSDDA